MTAAAVSNEKQNQNVQVERLGAHIGAEIHGVDLSTPLDDATFKVVHDALVDHGVLVFRDQEITGEQQLEFGRLFGVPTVHPFSPSYDDAPELIVLDNDGDNRPLPTDVWHSDETFRETPPMATILRATIVPPIGGDTMFASMGAAYDGLSAPMRRMLDGLTCEHDFGPFAGLFPRNEEGRLGLAKMEAVYPRPHHPVVRVHPVSGRRTLFVSAQFCTAIDGMKADESRALLDFLYQQANIAEYQFRVKWQPNTLVMWDNRQVVHRAVHDYFPHRRRMERVTLKGDKPAGPDVETSLDEVAEDLEKAKKSAASRPQRKVLVGIDAADVTR